MIARRKFLVMAAAAPLLALAACSDKPQGNGEPLRVGMELSYPPFEMQDKSGKPDGVSVELAEALARHLDRPLQIVPMDYSGLIPALKTGNIDLVISSMTATDERRNSIDFSEPYAFTGLALLVGKYSDVQSIDDLQKPNRTVAVKAATSAEAWVLAHMPQVKRVVFENQMACVLEVVQGRADGFIYDQLSIYRYAQENQETTRPLLNPFVEEAWAIGLAKGNDELKGKVNEFLAEFKKDGGLAKLGEKYLKDEKAYLEQAGIPFMLR